MSVLSFYVNNEGKIENVSYDPTLTVREFILDFLNKIQYHFGENFGFEKFTIKCRCKVLNTGKFLDKKIGDYIPPNGTVNFFRKQEICGCHITFEPSKASKYIAKEYQPGYKNLSYTKVNNGLNIQIKCNKGSCLANNTIIYVPLGYVEDFLFTEPICQYCKNKAETINFWVKDCIYQITLYTMSGKESSITGIADGFGNFVTFNDSEPIYWFKFNVKKR
jgi:hypothetical protein